MYGTCFFIFVFILRKKCASHSLISKRAGSPSYILRGLSRASMQTSDIHIIHFIVHHSYYTFQHTFQLIKHIITHMNLGFIHITHIGEPASISISMNIVIPPSLPFLRQFSILYHILSLFAVGLNGLARPEQCQYHKNRTGSNDQWSKPSFSEWI